MSLTRRLAAGLPAAGVAAFAALAFAGSPANAATADNAAAAHPAVMATPTCTDSPRSKCGYGHDTGGPGTPGNNDTAGPGSTGSGATAPGDHRGHPGYGTESPTTTPTSSLPPAITDTVPPTGGSPSVSTSETPGTGLKSGSLPLTGAPMGATMALGGLMVAAGGAAIWYTRRRRNA
jgi:LPXTG-motif cell wall-anchored protein